MMGAEFKPGILQPEDNQMKEAKVSDDNLTGLPLIRRLRKDGWLGPIRMARKPSTTRGQWTRVR